MDAGRGQVGTQGLAPPHAIRRFGKKEPREGETIARIRHFCSRIAERGDASITFVWGKDLASVTRAAPRRTHLAPGMGRIVVTRARALDVRRVLPIAPGMRIGRYPSDSI